jgi:hypothetical protein
LKNRRYVISVLVVAFLGWWLLWPDGQPTKEKSGGTESESSIDPRRLIKEREPLPPEERYGIAETSPSAAEETPFGKVRPYYYGQPWPTERPATSTQRGPDSVPRYTFRPLTDRERRRLETAPPVPYQYDHGTSQRRPVGIPKAFSGDSGYSYPQRHGSPLDTSQPNRWADGRYSFRPLESSPSRPQRWQGPYQEPVRDRRPDAVEPWTTPPDPQWGSRPPDYWTPPTERMYPNTDWSSGETLTAN